MVVKEKLRVQLGGACNRQEDKHLQERGDVTVSEDDVTASKSDVAVVKVDDIVGQQLCVQLSGEPVARAVVRKTRTLRGQDEVTIFNVRHKDIKESTGCGGTSSTAYSYTRGCKEDENLAG